MVALRHRLFRRAHYQLSEPAHDVGVAEAFGMARRPGRIDAVHVADPGVAGKAVDEDDVVGVAEVLHLLDDAQVRDL